MNTCTFSLLLTVALLALPSAKAEAEKPEYSIKEGVVEAGYTGIRRDRARGFDVAVNLPYERLPAADRQALHSLYDLIKEGDEPPFPLDGLQSIYKLLSQANDKFFDTGDLYFVATVDPAGQVQDVKISQSPSKEMTQFAANLVTLTKFKPAKCGGKACTMDFPVRVTFVVN
jgi:hypothetical protein